MSILGKGITSLRKKDVQEQKSTAVGFKKLVFGHKATTGDSIISLGALVAPSAEMPTLVNPTVQDLLSANLLFYKNNLTLISSLRGTLISDLSYKVNSSSAIEFIGFTAEENEIFVGIIDAAPKTGNTLVDARPIAATGTLADGATDFNVGQSFRVNNYPTTQAGDVIVYRNGIQQFRNVGNSPSGEGNYYEVGTSNGYGQVIRFNNAPVGQDDSIMVISNGLLAERPDGSMMAVIETLAGQVDALVNVVSEELDIDPTTFQTAPNEPDLKQFGDQVLDHENRITVLEDLISSVELHLDSGNGYGSTGTRIRRFSNVRSNTLGSAATYIDSSTDGMSVTISETGKYEIHYSDFSSVGAISIGISVNATSLSANLNSPNTSYAQGKRCLVNTPGANLSNGVTISLNLVPGDIVRAHTGGQGTGTTDDVIFRIIKVR